MEQRQNGRQCTATKADGNLCRGWAGQGSDFCLAHDPDRQELATAARRKGGLKYEPWATEDLGPPPTTHEGLIQTVAEAMQDLRAGRLDPKQADSIAKLAREQRALLQVQRDQADFEDEYEDTEAMDEAARSVLPTCRPKEAGGTGN